MSVVIDASITLPWYFQDEVSEKSEAVLDRVINSGAVVPAHWKLEIANAFRTAIRRKRMSASYREQSLADLSDLLIAIDPETNSYAWSSTLRLADDLGLTPYDAAYVELALRRQLPLASLDSAMLTAAAKVGIMIA